MPASPTVAKTHVGHFTSVPASQVDVKRIAQSVTLNDGDELRVILESYPTGPSEWHHVSWPSDILLSTGSGHSTSGGVITDEYRFKAVVPSGSTDYEMKLMLRFLYLSIVKYFEEPLLYEIEVIIKT